MMLRLLTTMLLAASIIAASPVAAYAETLSYFRQRGGVAFDDTRPLPAELDSKSGYVWRQELQPGNSTPCIYGDMLFVTTYDADKKELATVGLDRATGKVKWRQSVPAKEIEPFHDTGSPATCTPACDGERVYAFFGSYGLLCYGLDGQLVWSKKMGPFQDEFGANSSPVLVDDLIVLNQDHDIDNYLIAIDKKTGETVWQTPREGFTRSYSTPVVWEVDGRKEIVVAGALTLVAYDLKDGSRRWWVDGLARIISPTPCHANGLLYATGWTPGGDTGERISMEAWPDALKTYDKNDDGQISKSELPEGSPVLERFFRIDLNQNEQLDKTEWEKHARVFEQAQNTLLAIKPGGMSDVTKSHVKWIHRKSLPTISSPLAYRDVVYIVRDAGIITSLDAETGEVLKQGRAAGGGSYYASPVGGDGKVYLASERGVVTVLKADGDWEVIASHDFGERIMATPVIADGRIYVRTDDAVYCFGN